MWSAILGDRIITNPDNPRLWSLPDGISWFGGVKKLYNRKCYDAITDRIKTSSLTHLLVIGTPGIGKTLYLQIFLVHLARTARAENRATPSIHYAYYDVGGKLVILSLLADGSVVDISGDKNVPDPDYMLSDSVDLINAPGNVLNLQVASDKEANYELFQKRVVEKGYNGLEWIMPLFSFRELLFIRPANMDKKYAKFRYEVFGGSARNFIAVQKPMYDLLPIVENLLTLMFKDIKEARYEEWESVGRQISSTLNRKAAKGNLGAVNSMMWHMLPGGSKTWASKFMAFLAAEIYVTRSADIVDELEQLVGKSGISPKWHNGSLEQLSSIRTQLHKPDERKHRIISIIPPDNVKTFKYQKNLPEIRQFICVDDPSVTDETLLITDAEKRVCGNGVPEAKRQKRGE